MEGSLKSVPMHTASRHTHPYPRRASRHRTPNLGPKTGARFTCSLKTSQRAPAQLPGWPPPIPCYSGQAEVQLTPTPTTFPSNLDSPPLFGGEVSALGLV